MWDLFTPMAESLKKTLVRISFGLIVNKLEWWLTQFPLNKIYHYFGISKACSTNIILDDITIILSFSFIFSPNRGCNVIMMSQKPNTKATFIVHCSCLAESCSGRVSVSALTTALQYCKEVN